MFISRPPFADIVKIESIPISEITADDQNPNVMTKKQRDQLYQSIKRYGMVQPLVIDHNNIVINGNQKLLVIKMHEDLSQKYTTIPCYRTPKDMTAEDRLLLQQALNKIHGQHDITKDSAIFEKLIAQERGADLAAILGRKTDTISKLIQRTKDAEAGLTSHDTTTGKCKEGETWALGRHILHVGDCAKYHTEAQKEQISLLLTDPPYGISVVKDGQPGTHGMGTLIRKQYPKVAGDDKPYDPQALLDLKADTKIIFGANCIPMPAPHMWIVWQKRPSDAYRRFHTSDCELAWTSKEGGAVRAHYHLWDGAMRDGKSVDRIHPTQKPVELLRDIISDYSKEGDIIYDPYLGSGSTLMACEISNRTCIGVELSPEYCELIINRYIQHVGTDKNVKKVKTARM